MNMKWVFIKPSDVWFFRDARPFSLGEGHTVHTIFPPFPSTISGAIRSYLLAKSGVSFEAYKHKDGQAKELMDRIGYADELGNFRLQGPYLASRSIGGQTRLYAPFPADGYQKKDQRGRFHAFQPLEEPVFSTKWPDAQAVKPLWPPKGVRQDKAPRSGWLDAQDLQNYLANEDFRIREDPFESESRLGIMMDHTHRSAKEGHLYTAPFLRMKPEYQEEWGLLVRLNVNEIQLPETGWLALGGEARSAHYEVLDSDPWLTFSTDAKTSFIKVLLLTPAWFKDGWRPNNPSVWDEIFGMEGVRLISVALQRPLYIGGWDMLRGWHKDMHACIPPGSVYYFEFKNKEVNPTQFQDCVFTQSPSGQQYQHLGFGRIAVGVWEWQSNS